MKRYQLVARRSPYPGVCVGTLTVERDAERVPLCIAGDFGWGYEGEGSRLTAEAILADLLAQQPEYPLIADFVDTLLADEHRPRVTLTESELRAWLVARPPLPGLDAGAVR
jgi:hypothetical protein